MRAIVTAAFVAAALVGAAAAAPVAYEPGAFPRDEISLRDLDSRQLRIVRRAGAQCWHSNEGGFRSRSVSSRACIIGLADHAIADADDAALAAYHSALPFHIRYNEYRPAYYWQRFVQR